MATADPKLEAPYDARNVSNLILDVYQARGQSVSVLKLLKLLYFCYGWTLVSRDYRLFHNPILAWKSGPVVRCVWDEFKGRRESIDGRARILDLQTGKREVASAVLASGDSALVGAIALGYMNFSAWTLSEATHEANSPWHVAWHSVDESANLEVRISDVEIRRHFSEYPNRLIPV